jgi:hypothetical protein
VSVGSSLRAWLNLKIAAAGGMPRMLRPRHESNAGVLPCLIRHVGPASTSVTLAQQAQLSTPRPGLERTSGRAGKLRVQLVCIAFTSTASS